MVGAISRSIMMCTPSTWVWVITKKGQSTIAASRKTEVWLWVIARIKMAVTELLKDLATDMETEAIGVVAAGEGKNK